MSKRLFTMALAVLMLLSLAACGSTGENTPPAENNSGTDTPGTYDLSYNILGSGVVWMLDKYALETEYFVKDVMGCNFQALSANFTASQMQTDCQTLIQSGVDGHIYYGAFDSLTPTVSEMFKNAKIPFSMPDQLPSEESLEVLLDNPYFAGVIGGDYYDYGYYIGQLMAEAGCRNVLFLRGAYGDTAQEGYHAGLQAAMDECGGQILGVAVCTSPDEAVSKSQDLFAAYGAKADGVFAINKTYLDGAITAMDAYGYEMPMFSDCIDGTALDLVREGKLIACGGSIGYFSLCAALVINYLDGHPILDENGKPPVFNKSLSFKIDADRADAYQEIWLDGHVFTDEVWNTLLYRNNPDVSYDTWMEFLDNYSYDYVVGLHQ